MGWGVFSLGSAVGQFVAQCLGATSLPLAGKFGSLYLGRAQQLQEQQYPFLSVCIFMYPINGMAASVCDFEPAHGCWCMQLHMVGGVGRGGGCTVCKSLHWKLTLGEKSLAASGTRTSISIAPNSTNWAIPTPQLVKVERKEKILPWNLTWRTGQSSCLLVDITCARKGQNQSLFQLFLSRDKDLPGLCAISN